MESRMEKYYQDDNSSMQRSSKNAKLYKEVYRDYNDLENLPIPDNTNEIDIPGLKKLMNQDKEKEFKTREYKIISDNDDIHMASSNKIHDINKLLEYAKNENNKLKDNNHSENTSNYKYLETLEDKPITKFDINNKYKNEDKEEINDKEEKLFQTRELRYQTKKISDNPIIEQIIPEDSKEFNTASLSLDILSDLKPNGDTGVTKPVKEPAFEKMYENIKEGQEEKADIDIIKENINTEEIDEDKDSAFYTDLYKFSNKDFEADDEDDDESSGGFVIKIILLMLLVAGCGFVIFYFLTNYGFN